MNNQDLKSKNDEKYFKSSEELLEHLLRMTEEKEYVYRGYTKQDELLPSLIRSSNYKSFEKEMIISLEQQGSRFINGMTPIDLLSTAQHYGLPTRLLDFTFNPYIALRFALFKNKGTNYSHEGDKEYYYIQYCSLEENIYLKALPIFTGINFIAYSDGSISSQLYQQVEDLTKGMLSKNEKNSAFIEGLKTCSRNELETNDDIIKKIEEQKLCFINPPQSNQRVVMQQGLFLFPYCLEEKKYKEVLFKNSKTLFVHKSIRDELLRRLDVLGYNTYRLMPDLSSVCSSIVQEVSNRRRIKKVVLTGQTKVLQTIEKSNVTVIR